MSAIQTWSALRFSPLELDPAAILERFGRLA